MGDHSDYRAKVAVQWIEQKQAEHSRTKPNCRRLKFAACAFGVRGIRAVASRLAERRIGFVEISSSMRGREVNVAFARLASDGPTVNNGSHEVFTRPLLMYVLPNPALQSPLYSSLIVSLTQDDPCDVMICTETLLGGGVFNGIVDETVFT